MGLSKISKKNPTSDNTEEEKRSYEISQFVNVYNAIKPDTNTTSRELFITCLIYMILDYLYFFAYLLPLTIGISLYDLDSGLVYTCLTVTIAYMSDGGGLVIGNAFGKNNFGAPITPSKTKEGLYGSVAFA
jgi:CDP-diglyceride synthetase